MKTKVLQRLKPKSASLGFSQTELDGVAATLAGNLTDDATDEQIDSEIDKVLPFLRVSQSMATRVINAEKEKLKKPTETAPVSDKPKDDDDEPVWFTKYKENQKKELDSLRMVNVTKDRKATFEAKLEGLLPKQKEAKLKDFDRISFKDDADFDAYITEQVDVIKDIKQELADKGLETIVPPGTGGKSTTEEEAFIKDMKEINKET